MSDPTMLTVTGRTINILHPKPDDICVFDLGNGLAMEPRYSCQIRRPYSVGEHSTLGLYPLRKLFGDAVTPLVELHYLVHDSPEAYIKDMMGPFKHWDGMLGYQIVENRFEEAIMDALHLDPNPDIHVMVKKADKAMYQIENFQLRGIEAKNPMVPLDLVDLCYWDFEECKRHWIKTLVQKFREQYDDKYIGFLAAEGVLDPEAREVAGLDF